MNNASQRWMKTLAVWFGLAAPAWGQSLFPVDQGSGSPLPGGAASAPDDGYAAVKISDGQVVIADESAALRMGDNPSGSVAANPELEIQPSQYSSSTAIDGNVFPNAVIPENQSLGFASLSNTNRWLWRIDNTAGEQYGQQGGFTTISPFIPLFSSDTSVFWVNPRLFATDYGNGGGNVGTGFRWYNPGANRVHGVSGWWDTVGGYSERFNMLGMNFESIGQYVSYRGGFSVPVGDDMGVRSTTRNADAVFLGHNLAQSFTFLNEQVFSSIDAEVAVPMPGLGRYGIDFGVGAYFLEGSQRSSTGGVSLRLQGQVTEDFWMNGIYTYDRLFGSQVSINMELTIPDGHPTRWFRRNPVVTALTQSVQRRYRVPVGTYVSDADVLARCMDTGDVIRVAHIVPGSPAGGDGTIENPFATSAEWDALSLADKAGFEIVLVDGGTGSGAGLTTGITIVENQRLLSRSVTHSVTALFDVPDPTLLTFALPLTGVGPNPLLTRANSTLAGEGVVIIDNRAAVLCDQLTEVSGFNISGAVNMIASGNLNSGIITADLSPTPHPGATGVTGFNINRNTITGTMDAVNITHVAGGAGLLLDNTVTGGGFLSNSGMTVRQAGAGTLFMSVRDNVVTNVRGEDRDGDGNLDLGGGAPGTDEDLNDNGVLDPGEDLDLDGFNDSFEDNNLDGLLQPGWAMNLIADGAGAVINASLPGFTIEDNSTTGNGGGIRLESRAGADFLAFVESNTMDGNLNPNAAGFRGVADAGDLFISSYASNTTNANSGNGAEFNALNAGNIEILAPILTNTFDNNLRNGLLLTAFGGSTLEFDIGDSSVPVDPANPARAFSNTFNNNGSGPFGGSGIRIELDASTIVSSALNPTDIFNVQASGNADNGIAINAVDSIFNNLRILAGDVLASGAEGILIQSDSTGANIDLENLTIVSNNVNNSGGDGVNLEMIDTNLVDAFIDQNIITASGGSGLNFEIGQLNGALLPAGDGDVTNLIIQRNAITGSGQDGVRMLNPQFASAPADQTARMLLNTLTGNTGFGVNILLDNTNSLLMPIYLNNISANAAGGLNVRLEDSASFSTGAGTDGFYGNTVDGNGGVGLRVTAIDASTFDINLSAINASTFNNNLDAGIALILEDFAVGGFSMSNATITGTLDGPDANPLLDGSGLVISMIDFSNFTSLNIGSPTVDDTFITDNAGHGVNVFAGGFSSLTVANILNTAITGNALDGIHTQREGSATINAFRIGGPDAGNTITGNGDDGIELRAENSSVDDDYIIEENLISLNGGNGILLSTFGDAEMFTDILFNQITLNGANGIATEGATNDITDDQSFTGQWLGNRIAENALDGIVINNGYGEINGALVPLQIGANGVDGQGRSFGNEIVLNGGDGIEMNSGGASNIINNMIADNGETGIELNFPNLFRFTSITDNRILRNGVHGIDMNYTQGTSTTTIQRNEIRFNVRDGIQFRSGTSGAGANQNHTGSLFITDFNDISDNFGRGVDILVQGNSDAVVVIDEAFIERNGEEGVYAIVTSSTTQDNEVPSTDLLAADGAVDANPFLDLFVSNSSIIDNGSDINEGPTGGFASGIVIRVGTSGGGQGFTAPGGQLPTTALGGLNAGFFNNLVDNNFGIDFWIDTFTSTGDPATTGGAWTDQNEDPRNNANDLFTPGGYQSDPLARIHIRQFQLMFGDSATVTGNPATQAIQAFYNNDEPIFKSRTQAQDNATDGGPLDDPGPFTTGTRRRNATRLASRAAPFDDPSLSIGASDTFLYPGVGATTLTYSAALVDPAMLGFGASANTFNFLEAVPGGGGVGELPYVWLAIP